LKLPAAVSALSHHAMGFELLATVVRQITDQLQLINFFVTGSRLVAIRGLR
jgi:hypothetical protein